MGIFGPPRKDQLEALRHSHERLRTVISELLAQADEVDQQSKFEGHTHNENRWAKELREACSELVRLADDLPKIEQFLHDKKVKESREMILASCSKAVEVARKLDSIRQL